MSDLDQSVARLRRHLNLDQRRGILGDNSGVVRDTVNGGYYVRIEKSPGNYYPPVSIPLSPTATVAPKANIPVYVGYDPVNKRDVITGMVATGLEQIGISPFITNPSDPAAADLVPQERLSALYSRPHTDSLNKPFYAIVYPAKIIDQNGALTSWVGGEIDLAGYAPASGQHRYVVVFLKSNFTELEASGSVAQAVASPLGDSDLNEALVGGSSGSIPVRAYSLAETDVSLNPAFVDSPFLRQFITTRSHYPSATYFDASQITYTPAVDTHWTGSVDPGNDDDALDQLALRVTSLEEAGPTSSEFYLTDTASDLAGYLAMTPAIGGTQSTVVATVTGADQAIQEWATPANSPGLSVLSGIVHFHIHAEQTAGTKTVQFYTELYKRTTGGVETLLGTTELTSAIPGSETHIEIDVFIDEADMAVTDRIIAKVLATPGGAGTDPELTLYMEGTTNARLSIPVTMGDINAAQIGYTPAVQANWDDSADPGMTNDALDQLAERVTDIGSSHLWRARLTLESGVPISTTDQTAKTVVYLTPYRGNKISLYDGARWQVHTLSEISIKTTDAQTGTTHNGTAVIDGLTDTSQLIVGMEVTGTGVGASANIVTIDSATQVTVDANSTANGTVTITFKVPANTALDVFCYSNSGTPKLEMVAWTNITTRATALTMQDSVQVKNGAATRVLVGSICTTATAGQVEDSIQYRLVQNYRRRVRRRVGITESTNSWTYNTTNTWRSARGQDTNRIAVMVCLSEDFLALFEMATYAHSVSGGTACIGIAQDATNTNDIPGTANIGVCANTSVATANTHFMPISARWKPIPAIGYHYFQWTENNFTAGTTTFYSKFSTFRQSGIVGTWRC